MKPVFINQYIDAIKGSLESRNVMQFTIAGTLDFDRRYADSRAGEGQ